VKDSRALKPIPFSDTSASFLKKARFQTKQGIVLNAAKSGGQKRKCSSSEHIVPQISWFRHFFELRHLI